MGYGQKIEINCSVVWKLVKINKWMNKNYKKKTHLPKLYAIFINKIKESKNKSKTKNIKMCQQSHDD